MMKKELRDIASALQDQGFQTRLSTKGHLLVTQDGQFVTVFAGTPSDVRSWRNSISAARRAGFVWPPPR